MDDPKAAARRRAAAKAPIAEARGLSLGPKPVGPVVVVTLCKDRPEVVRSFIRQQMAQGVPDLRVYFDDPDDAALPWAAGQPGVTAIPCNAAFWAAANWRGTPERPVHIEARQGATGAHAYASVPPGRWVGFCDIDELFVPHTDFPTLLDGIAPDVEQIRGDTAEAIWAPEDDPSPLKSTTLARMVVRDRKVLDPAMRRRSALFRTFGNKGLIGHVSGKAMIRSGLPDAVPIIHIHKRRLADGTVAPLKTETVDMTLLHFDALSYDIWCEKHLRRLARETAIGGNPPNRSAQSALFGLCTHEEGRREVFQQFYGTAPDYLREMVKIGALMRLDDHDPSGD